MKNSSLLLALSFIMLLGACSTVTGSNSPKDDINVGGTIAPSITDDNSKDPVDIEAVFLKKVAGKTAYIDSAMLPKDIDGIFNNDGTIYTRDSTNPILKKEFKFLRSHDSSGNTSVYREFPIVIGTPSIHILIRTTDGITGSRDVAEIWLKN